MPSPRSSPALRPSSPLSPGYKGSTHYEPGMRLPSPRSVASRPGAARRSPTSSLKLPPLPRFHPANFPSSNSSVQNTPDSISSPQPPLSPRSYSQRNDLKKQMYLSSQRELMSSVLRGSSPGQIAKPASPRLAPMGSPGPVTPLELEEHDSYLVAGLRHATHDAGAAERMVESFVEREVRRQQQRAHAGSSTGP